MRKHMAIYICFSLMILPVQAEETKYVALTFDGGPSGKYTRKLLDGLYDRGFQASVLLCGYRMKDYPGLTKRIWEEGHEIGYHGFTHKNMQQMSRREIAKELEDSQALLPEGCGPVFLRAPGGCCSDAVLQVAQVRNLGILNCSVDTRDWATHDTASIERFVLKNVKDGDIVLLHDMSDSSVKAALDIVDVLLDKDYEIVTVSRLVRIRGVKLKAGQVYGSLPRVKKSP